MEQSELVLLTPSWGLTRTKGGQIALLHRQTGATYQASDVVTLYPSWGPQPAHQAVRRARNHRTANAHAVKIIQEFLDSAPPAIGPGAKTGHIHIRTSMDRKAVYVQAAQSQGLKLTEWIERQCDRAAGYLTE